MKIFDIIGNGPGWIIILVIGIILLILLNKLGIIKVKDEDGESCIVKIAVIAIIIGIICALISMCADN